MEDMFWKFPLIGNQIFKNLSNKNLTKYKEVSRTWERFITNEIFYKQRVQHGYENLQNKRNRNFYGETYLHKAARKGLLSNCKLVIENVENR